jgi:hypothetical protein
MIEGPVGDMLKRNKAKEGYTPPPALNDISQMLLETRVAIVVLACADPRIDPGKALGLDGGEGEHGSHLSLQSQHINSHRASGRNCSKCRRASGAGYTSSCWFASCAQQWDYSCYTSHWYVSRSPDDTCHHAECSNRLWHVTPHGSGCSRSSGRCRSRE